MGVAGGEQVGDEAADQRGGGQVKQPFRRAARHEQTVAAVEQENDRPHALEQLLEVTLQSEELLAGAADLLIENPQLGVERGDLRRFGAEADRVGGELAGGDAVDGFADAGQRAEQQIGEQERVEDGDGEGEGGDGSHAEQLRTDGFGDERRGGNDADGKDFLLLARFPERDGQDVVLRPGKNFQQPFKDRLFCRVRKSGRTGARPWAPTGWEALRMRR